MQDFAMAVRSSISLPTIYLPFQYPVPYRLLSAPVSLFRGQGKHCRLAIWWGLGITQPLNSFWWIFRQNYHTS